MSRCLPGDDGQSVLPGQIARFWVSVQSASPAAYRWRLNGVDLPGGTERTLVLTNVEWSGLGPYEVVVSNDAGEVTSAPGWMMLATRWSEMIYFGGSEERARCQGEPW